LECLGKTKCCRAPREIRCRCGNCCINAV
jgi:hypothetical protein